MRTVAAVIALVACAHAGLWALSRDYLKAPDFDGQLASVSYAPFAGTAHPDSGTQAQAAQIDTLNAAYQAAITAPVSYTNAAGATATFNQDSTAKSNLQNALLASQKSQTWPLGLWLDVSGRPITPFTYADLQGLAEAMEAADTPDYQKLLTLIGQVSAATTVEAVQAVVWG